MIEVRCERCDVVLLGEQFAGPPKAWFANEGVASIAAARQGWREQVCPVCQREEHDDG